ncbi:MAG: lysylphosphatidylglycerol synthase transmembrane domain-containing protein [Candidatus Daviesbacteria bacterium]|nr:lysylphosphatidylglycerol synthase transmembrane domain-containing protein [Candidatus Daviesbacteria bacterium]
MNKSLILKVLLNSVVGLVLIIIWSRFVDLNDISSKIWSINPNYIAIFFGLFILSGLLRALRFKMLLSEFQIPLKDLSMLHYLCQLLSFMIPIRVGEITKSIYLNSIYNLPLGKSLVWVFIDRFVDFWTVLLMIGLLLPAVLGSNSQIGFSVYIILAAFTLVSYIVIKNAKFTQKMVIFLSRFLVFSNIKRAFLSVCTTIIEGFEILNVGGPKLLLIILITVAAYSLDGLAWYFLLSFLSSPLSLSSSILGNLLLALTFIIPSAPGYVGSTEAAGLAVFSGLLSVDPKIASAATVFYHILIIVSVLIFGIVSLYFLKFDLNSVWKKLKRE